MIKLSRLRTPLSRLPLQGKVFLVCIALAILVSFSGSIVLYRGAKYSLRQEVRKQLAAVAATAALQVSPELHSKIRTRADESGDAYRKIKSELCRIKRANKQIRYVYTLRRTGKKHLLEFVVDAEDNPKLTSHVGDKFDASRCPEMWDGFYQPSADQSPNSDKWGAWLSGYAPIKDKKGVTVAIIGLDMSVSNLRYEEMELRRAVINSMLVGLLLAISLSLLVTAALVRPVNIFTAAARRVERGDLDFQIGLEGSDEIVQFGNAFDRMIVALKQNRDRLMEQATRDFLTGLYSHMYLHERLYTEIDRAKRYDRNLCLLLIGVDHFRSANDTYGHAVGDCLLRQLGVLLQESTRSIDVAARYAGDEFAVILPETDHAAAMLLADRIREKIESYGFYAATLEDMLSEGFDTLDRDTIHLTVSVGLASYPEHHTSKDGLVMAADIALCRAKQILRNSVCSYGEATAGEQNVDPLALYHALRDPNAAAIQSLAAAVDARDRYTHGHSERVTEYALEIGKMMGLDSATLEMIKVAGLLHDLGKIGVPDSILNKPGNLTEEEREAIKRHPAVGGEILRRAPQLDVIIPGVLGHHERWDGRGYPEGLSGFNIPLMARILAVADSFDAMTSDRPYHKAMPFIEALSELQVNAGKQFDPDIVQAFAETPLFAADQQKAA